MVTQKGRVLTPCFLLFFIHIFIIRIDIIRIIFYYNNARRKTKIPMKPREMEKLILADGWMFKNQEGSHKNYIHPTKPGKVTIPFHTKYLPKGTENSIKKQAGLK
jgi:predicted RNA binding protein YcfA (HicA-like mRNA interferase family)